MDAKRVATATTHTIRILLVCGAVLRLPGSHGLSAVRIARATHRPTVPRQRRSLSLSVRNERTNDPRDWPVDGFSTNYTPHHNHNPHQLRTLSQLTLWLMSDSDALVPCQYLRLLGTEKQIQLTSPPCTDSGYRPLSSVAYPIPASHSRLADQPFHISTQSFPNPEIGPYVIEYRYPTSYVVPWVPLLFWERRDAGS